MGSPSISTLSLCPQTDIPNIRISGLGFFNRPKRTLPFNPNHQQKSLSCHPKLQPTSSLKVQNFYSLSYFPRSSLLQVPGSDNSRIHFSFSLQNHIFNICAKKLTVLLVGSLIFLGSINTRPVLALPTVQKTSSSSPMEEERDTQNDKSDNEEMYLKILEKNPRDVEALKVILLGKMRKGKTKEALEYVEKLIDVEPDEVEWRLLQALSYEMMGHLSKAKRLFKEILEERPLLLRALHGLALVMHKNHEGPAVFEMLDKALELAQREKRVTEERNIRILVAQMHVVKGDLEGGLKKFQDLVNENHQDFRPYLCQGIIYSLLGKKKEAEEQFETYRSLVPQEFPQRGFLDDVVLTAKTESREQLEKEFNAAFSYRK